MEKIRKILNSFDKGSMRERIGMQFLNVYHGTWMKGHFRIFFIGILGLLFLMVFSSACSEKSKKSVAASIPVIVSTVIQNTVPVQIRAIGNVQACSTVTVKAKVGGELARVYFTEVQDARKGELLFTIDPVLPRLP